MERISTWRLREKDVINLCDGRNLGCPEDFEINVSDGRITAIVVSRPSGFLGLSHEKDIIIPWSRVECIGNDAILVKLMPGECNYSPERDKRCKC